MIDKKFIFLGGLHRSGTSLLHEIIRNHPSVTGISNTDVFEDEGQHLQSVFFPGIAFGGPGKFAFNKKAYMNENNGLVSNANSERIFSDWSQYLDLSAEYIIEKSPPNLIRTRFLQALLHSLHSLLVQQRSSFQNRRCRNS